MSSLQERARSLMLAQDFGAEAVEVNRQLVATDPSDLASRTRLARCLLESDRLDEAEVEYRAVLTQDPKSRIALGGIEAIAQKRRLAEFPEVERQPGDPVRPKRVSMPRSLRTTAPKPVRVSALADHSVPQVFSGFARPDFTELALCRGVELRARFGPRVIDFVRRVNALASSQEIASIREAGRRQLFRVGRADLHVQPAHWHVYNLGGRWEPQFNIGMYGGSSKVADWLRVGLGFNLTDEGGGDTDRAEGLRELRRRFHAFQELLESPRRSLLLGWMIKENALIQDKDSGPRLDLADPSLAMDAIVAVDSDRAEWVFVGKWLSPDQPDDLEVLSDPVSLVRTVDRVFTGLLPLWRALWE